MFSFRHLLLAAHSLRLVFSIQTRDEALDNATYDYIIVGGGTSGLVIANRLTEDSQKSVLVIERGAFDDSPKAIIPYWGRYLDTSVMLNPTSAPIPGLNNASFRVPVAAVVGGGTVVNGMGYGRGSKADYDAWEELGNPGWGWDGLLPYFIKSTTFIPPSPDAVEQWNMTWNPSVYDNGPLHITIPDFQYPDLAIFRNAWGKDAGIGNDASEGIGPGLYWSPESIDARDMTRATARKAYYDPVYQTRPNLKLLTSHTVSEILFHNLTATGIKATSSGKSSTFYARREVILAAGAVQTAHLLQISGIGPKEVLQAAGVQVKKDMAAVGANFQDHATIQMVYNLSHQTFPNYDSLDQNATYNATAFEEYFTSHTGPVAAGSGSTSISFSLPQITNSSASLAEALLGQTAQQYLPEIYGHTHLLAGFKAQREILAKRYAENVSAVVSGAVLGTGFSFMPFLKPLSRGTVTLNASDPQGLPVVQYNTLMNPIDIKVLVAAIKHRRRLWSSPELDIFEPIENIPGLQYQSDDDIAEALRSFTNPGLAHESCSCPMMPEHLGGCVGSDLQVYGINRLSIVDASVFPLIPGVSLQGTVYAVAEKAADLIKARAK